MLRVDHLSKSFEGPPAVNGQKSDAVVPPAARTASQSAGARTSDSSRSQRGLSTAAVSRSWQTPWRAGSAPVASVVCAG